ncbi:hypothetical protein [Fretibacter rubidus]|uniref:hypothetical protein n=1 Tax=Fretibacter rubidus TaxID=570162 RepID=UPI00352B127D
MGRYFFLALLFCGLSVPHLAYAGAWTLPKGDGQLISTVVYSNAARAFDADRGAGAVVDFLKTEQSVYLEHGLTSRATVVASGALQDISYIARDGRQQYSGLGTSRIGLRYGLKPRGAWVLSVQPSVVIPAGGESVPDADLGRGGLGGELRMLAGRNIKVLGHDGFIDIQTAFDYRSGDAPEQVMIDGTLGADITPKLQILGQAFAQYTTSGQFGADQVLENDSVRLQGSIVWRYSETSSLQLGAFQTVIGRNTVRQQGVSLGVWQRF